MGQATVGAAGDTSAAANFRAALIDSFDMQYQVYDLLVQLAAPVEAASAPITPPAGGIPASTVRMRAALNCVRRPTPRCFEQHEVLMSASVFPCEPPLACRLCALDVHLLLLRIDCHVR